jgi:hypothetical protein
MKYDFADNKLVFYLSIGFGLKVSYTPVIFQHVNFHNGTFKTAVATLQPASLKSPQTKA